jgi:hypothetical protein
MTQTALILACADAYAEAEAQFWEGLGKPMLAVDTDHRYNRNRCRDALLSAF